MLPDIGPFARHCVVALTAVSQLEAILRRDGASPSLSKVVRLCQRIERTVGRGAGVAEKVASILRQAWSLEKGRSVPLEEARQAKLIFLSDCSSLRQIIERLRWQ